MGTLINVVAIIIGGIIGLTFGRFIKERVQQGINMACGVSVLFIGMSGALTGMLEVNEGAVGNRNGMLVTGCLALGTLIGELIDIEAGFERFGVWLREKTGNSKDKKFVDGFVTASLTVCIGAMAIVGSIQDGITGDYSVLATKAILDLIIIVVMTCSMGKGCAFSAIPVGILQGTVTLLAKLISPIVTDAAMANLSFIGSILIFCVGINLVWGKKVRVANMLPSLIFAVAAAFIL